MAEHRSLFRDGAAKNGLTQQKADEIFDLMERFAGYGFNKSHAAAYALLSYYTAWFKAHHPAEFMAANMSLAMDDTDKVKILYEDSLANQLIILPPDINHSDYRFVPVDTKTIRYGLGAIKGTGEAAVLEIIRARAQKPFSDLFDFCHRVDRRTVNKRAIEGLIRAGAFDAIEANRAQLLASIGNAVELAEQLDATAHQAGLFDHATNGDGQCHGILQNVAPWLGKRTLQEEKQALGFYLSGHLFDDYRDEVLSFTKLPLAKVSEGRDRLIAGIITAMRTQLTQRGKMLIVLLDDGSAQLEVSVYNELYESKRTLFKEDELLVVKGSIRQDNFSGGFRIIAENVMDLTLARMQFARHLRLSLQPNIPLDRLRSALNIDSHTTEVPESVPIHAHLTLPNAQCELTLNKKVRLALTDDNLQALREIGCTAEIIYQ